MSLTDPEERIPLRALFQEWTDLKFLQKVSIHTINSLAMVIGTTAVHWTLHHVGLLPGWTMFIVDGVDNVVVTGVFVLLGIEFASNAIAQLRKKLAENSSLVVVF